MTLTDDDLAMLRDEGCLVFHDDSYIGDYGRECRQAERKVLEQNGLVVGQPAEHLVKAAVRRRGWLYRDGNLDTGRCGARVWRPEESAIRRPYSMADDPATALALAFAAAIRAARDAEGATA